MALQHKSVSGPEILSLLTPSAVLGADLHRV